MTTPLEEVIRKVVDDWVDRPNGHVAQHIARAVLAHLAERREQPPAEGGTWTPRGFVAALTRERDSLKAENAILTAQAAAHGEDVRTIQVRMLKMQEERETVRETLLRWYRLDLKPSGSDLTRLIDMLVAEIASPPSTKGAPE